MVFNQTLDYSEIFWAVIRNTDGYQENSISPWELDLFLAKNFHEGKRREISQTFSCTYHFTYECAVYSTSIFTTEV